MEPKEANRKTIENIRRYLDFKSGMPVDTSKAKLLEEHGFKEVGESYETYIKVRIPKGVYESAKDGEELKGFLIGELSKRIKPI